MRVSLDSWVDIIAFFDLLPEYAVGELLGSIPPR